MELLLLACCHPGMEHLNSELILCPDSEKIKRDISDGVLVVM